jgi:ATP-binding cassette subfamily B protein
MTDQYYEEEEFQTRFNGGIVLRILGQTRPHWRWVAGFLIAVLTTSVLDGYFTFLSKRIVDEGIVARNTAALIRLVTTYGVLIFVQALAVFCFIFLTAVLGERIRYDLRKSLFHNLQDLSLSYFSRTPVGWIMSRVTSDTERVSDLVTWGMVDVSWALSNILTSAFFMLRINARLAALVLTILPILYLVSIQFRRHILKEFRNVRRMNSKITGAYNENIMGVRVVKALGREDANTQEFGNLTREMYRSSYRAAWLSALFLPTVQIISAFAVGGLVWYGGLQAQLGGLSIGGIQAFISYITFMIWHIQDLARVFAEMQQSIASAERMYSLMDATSEVRDLPGSYDPGSISADIEFEHVDFFYEDGKPVLQDFNLYVRRGETIALVGPTGVGKSTIINLLCRFYEPKRGVIRIGGQDYTKFTLQSIQSRIGVVLQTPHLFSGSIRENIRYGDIYATNEQVETAARLAGAHEFIVAFEKGYETQVGEGGNLLSTGQKQLISLARAVLAKPEIFIMDEATSSVDTLTEALIQKGMENLMKDCTSFIIAHRLSTIRRADRILVIDNGRVQEMGTHAQLLALKGQYYRLYTRQFRHEAERQYHLLNLAGVATD